MTRHVGIVFVLALGAALHGQDDTTGKTGLRQRLEQRGISWGAAYTAEGFTNGNGAHYLGSLSASAVFNMKRLGIGHGEVFLSAQELHGKGINDRLIGAFQPPSNLEEDRFHKIAEAWYSDSYLDRRLRIKAGRQYADSEFGVVENGADFLNAAYGVIPTTPMATYPDPELGVAVWTAPTRSVSMGFGLYRGGSLDSQAPLAVIESKITATQRDIWRVGFWRQAGNHGAYAVAEHQFGEEGDNRPSVFGRWGWAPSTHNEIHTYATSGFVYRGVGAGVTSVRSLEGRPEVGYELFYKRRIRERLTFQPDVQWFVNPGGTGPRHLVVGLRLTLEL